MFELVYMVQNNSLRRIWEPPNEYSAPKTHPKIIYEVIGFHTFSPFLGPLSHYNVSCLFGFFILSIRYEEFKVKKKYLFELGLVWIA